MECPDGRVWTLLRRKHMKKIYVAWTYLDIIEVEDDATPDEIEELLDDCEPARNTWNDREWDWVKED